jgi:CheY-like chemotaxis protein
LSARTILLVEDDPAEVRLIQRAFKKAGIEDPVLRLTDGDDAVAYLNGEAPYENRVLYPFPTILLLDLKMPRRGGLEVLEWVRSRTDSRRRLPIVVLTSSRHSVDVNRAYDLGANSYLTKPDTSEELLKLAGDFKEYWLRLNENPDLFGAGAVR